MSQRARRLRTRLAWIAPLARTGLAYGSSARCDVGGQIVSSKFVAGAAGQSQIERELPHTQRRPFLHADVKFHEERQISGYHKVLCRFAVGHAFEAVLPDIACLIES